MSKLPEPDFFQELQKKFSFSEWEFQKNYHIWDCQKIDKKGRSEKWKKIKNGGNDNGKNAHMTLGLILYADTTNIPNTKQHWFLFVPKKYATSLLCSSAMMVNQPNCYRFIHFLSCIFLYRTQASLLNGFYHHHRRRRHHKPFFSCT